MEALKDYFFSSRPWISIAIIAIALLIRHYVRKLLHHSIAAHYKGNNSKKSSGIRFVITMVDYIFLLNVFVVILQINGVNVNALLAGIGIIGLVIGYAAQDLIHDIVMGGTIAVEDFYQVGDVVSYNNAIWLVKGFNARATQLKDLLTDDVLSVSNRNITEIRKYSGQFTMTIPAPYDISAAQMMEVCREICRDAEKNSLIHSCECLGVNEFGDSQINYLLRASSKPIDREVCRREILRLTQDIYEKHQISIPYPQLDIHFKNASGGSQTAISPFTMN